MSEEEQKELSQKETSSTDNPLQPNVSQDESNALDLYKPSSKTPGGKLRTLLGSKKFLVGGLGAGLLAIVISVGSFLGFLNTFKLEHIMKNIENRTFVRYQVAMDGRSSKWIKAYMILRLGEIEDPDIKPADRDNLWFRSDKVDTNNPITDWYKTLRTSQFENDLWEKQGIRFTSKIEKHGNIYRVRWAKIQIKKDIYNLELPTGDIDITKPNQLNGNLNKFVEEVDTFDSDKAARKAIKQAVESETKSWQVIKRRHLRKNIQNMLGVREWRFFETTRDKVDNKVRSVRNKIVSKALPVDTVTGKFIQCIFGMVKCDSTGDPSDPKNQADGDASSGKNKDDGRTDNDTDTTKDTTYGDDKAADAIKEAGQDAVEKAGTETAEDVGKKGVLVGLKTMFIKSIVQKIAGANAILGWAQLVDTLVRISDGLSNGSLIKLVTIARGAQAMGLFSLYMTANDQLKTGEVTGEEVGEFMQTVNSVSNSEGWTSVISNSKDSARAEGFTAAKNKEEYCSPEHQNAILLPENASIAEKEFHYLCGSMQIGGSSMAASITNWWDKYIGPIVDPVIAAYKATGLSAIMSVINSIIGKVTDAIIGPLLDGILRLTGLQDNIESLVGWLVGQIASALGAGPMMDGNEPSGVYFNQLIQGGSFSAEASARAQGASATNTQTAELTRQLASEFQRSKSSQGIYQRYLALDNANSALSNFVFESINNNNVNNFASLFVSIVKRIAMAPVNIMFASNVKAGTDDPYAAAKFADIQTYDFPQQCYSLDPLTMTPSQVTNANQILRSYNIETFSDTELTWDLVNNNTEFYSQLYSKIRSKIDDTKKVEEIALKVYNCAAMDTTIRGGLGFAYGYTNDNGLEGSSSSSTGSSEADANLNWLKQDSDNIPCYGTAGETKDLGVVQSLYTGSLSGGSAPKIRLCQIKSIDGFGNNTSGSLISGGAVVSSGISENWYKLGKAIKDEKNITLSALSSFRLADSCNGNGDGNLCARPGQSLHQAGIAIDFVGMNSKNPSASCSNRASEPNNAGWLWLKENAERFGIYQYARESWHWDPGAKFGLRCDSNGDASG